ncbi:hypothetical protein D8L92_02605 [Capnocytophaga canimorsus]|nr:hypothetical protein D8L92_02605 [Capnocytophaga canimorsus]
MLCSGEQKMLPIGRIKVSFEKERKSVQNHCLCFCAKQPNFNHLMGISFLAIECLIKPKTSLCE